MQLAYWKKVNQIQYELYYNLSIFLSSIVVVHAWILMLESLGLGCDKVGTMVGELLPTTILSYIDSLDAIDIHAKTCWK